MCLCAIEVIVPDTNNSKNDGKVLFKRGVLEV